MGQADLAPHGTEAALPFQEADPLGQVGLSQRGTEPGIQPVYLCGGRGVPGGDPAGPI